MMRAIIAAGGTGGHINPAIAIADEIMAREPGSEIMFVGRETGMEKKLTEKAGYPLFHIETHGFQRGMSPSDIAFNVRSVFCAAAALGRVGRLIRDFSPDAVIGCGGYVSGPVVLKASMMGVVTAIQEQNAYPGVTSRMLAKRADLIFAPSEDAVPRLGRPEKTFVVGNPIRQGFFEADRTRARSALGVGDRVCVLSFGGSLGARTINRVSAAFASRHHSTGFVYQIHSTGQYGVEMFPQMLREYGVDPENPNIKIVEYIDDMQSCLAAADLVISRAGAISLSEIAASGTASVLIPSPNVTENHQYYNAMTLVNAGAAEVFEEKDLDVQAVADRIMQLTRERNLLAQMGINARRMAHLDAASEIYKRLRERISQQ